MRILVTGGAGYIGSHTCLELLNAGYDVTVADDLSNSSETALLRVQELAGRTLDFYRINVCDKAALGQLFGEKPIDCVIHFAGYKAVGESVAKPLTYYANNLGSTVALCETMLAHGVSKIVFSSSATVYAADNDIPYTETGRTGDCSNPYGWTKFMCEQILRDTAKANAGFSAALLRYFNPVGAHESGCIGEDPAGVPNNLMPFIAQTAVGIRKELSVFGDDYDTPDGTGVRDYLHVCDLARGHVAAIDYLQKHEDVYAFNLGTGRGTSVLEMIRAFERASGVKIPYRIAERRPGDLAMYYADPSKSERELHWKAERSIEDMCRDAWRWQSNHPHGYTD